MPFSLSDIRTHLFASVLSDCLDSVAAMNQALPQVQSAKLLKF